MAVTRRGLYFSLDALLALGLVALGLVFLASTGPPPSTDVELRSTQLRQADAVSESSMQVAMRQPLRRSLSQAEQDHYIDTTRLLRQDLNKSVMEAVAVLWASNDTAAARNLTRSFFSTIIPDRYGYRVVLADDRRQLIYNTSVPRNTTYLATSARIISGVSRNRPTRGFIARASLSETTKQATENVFYGGYVGDGNLTSNVTLPDLHTVLNVTMEGDIAGPFDLYFNDKYAGHFIPQAANLSADLFHVCNRDENASVCDALDPGGNRVNVNFTTSNRSIGGGVLRITYNRTTGLREEGAQFLQKRKRIHGIDGTMNLFSSFYVPGELHTARGHLHYTTPENRTLFLRIGNATVYERETSGEVTVTLDNDTIHSNITATGMDYDRMSQRTVPFRLGLQDVAFVEKEAIADSVSVIDVSGSMGGGKLAEAKDAAKAFSRIILDAAGNRAGMVAYEDSIDTTHPLTRNESSLNDTIDGLTDGGNTCIGCGILEAIDVLETPAYTRIIEPGSSWRYNTTYPDSEPPSIGVIRGRSSGTMTARGVRETRCWDGRRTPPRRSRRTAGITSSGGRSPTTTGASAT
ncbi:MAG: vWA domain-containing protein [Candidatus Nanohaloarchaea archaeon]|nr:vWA domain-containing protein [Candidatus Nanohaloarchaea archaeon]